MGKNKKPQTTVTEYYASLHMGVCIGPIDAFRRIIVKEKLAWSGYVTTKSKISVHNDGLFGDSKKEGGVRGVAHMLPGADDQTLYDELAVKLGRANGADCPGYRGIASIFFTGSKGISASPLIEPTPRNGFYWVANSPYLPGIWVTVERAPIGLDPAIAMIGSSNIEAGDAIELTWQQNSFDQAVDDEARMGIAFLDINSDIIGSITWAAWYSALVWTERTLTETAPSGARMVRFYMEMRRNTGTHCDGYIDAIEATCNGEAMPLRNTGAESGVTGWTSDVGGIDAWDPSQGLPGTPAASAGSFFFSGGNHASTRAYQGVGAAGGDANPAHIIYECLTNVDWGMGSPSTAIDFDAFSEAAETLYAEAFGLSMLWTRQASIQDFVQEVLDHIQAVLFVDPATGLLTLKLIRGDYDVGTLPEINPDNANLASFKRKLWGEIVNEIIVTWTNPDNEQDETVTLQDLASIATQGGIISDGRNYYGVRNAALASQLAQRDLRSSGSPLASCEAEVDRTLWEVRPGSVFALVWPEYGLDGVVMRVVSVDYGKPGDPTIKLSLLEDVYGLDIGTYDDPPSSGWIDPSSPPAPLEIEQVFTMPLFMAANSSVAAFVDDPAYPEVVAGVLGTTSDDDTYAYDLWSEVTLSNGSLEWQSLGTNNVIGHAELVGALAAEASSTGVTFDTEIGETVPTVGGFVIIGDDGEEGNEIAMIEAIGTDYDLTRGVLDTVPRAWPAGTPVWFIDEGTIFEDPGVRSSGETVEYKLLSRTSQGVLAIADAALVSYELTDRPWQPNRPANVVVYGEDFNTLATAADARARPDPWVTVSWANRNRLMEDSQVLSWTDATMTIETGQTTTIEVLAEDGTTVLATHDALSGTTFDVPDVSFGGESYVLIRVGSSRTDADGTFSSLQAHGVWVQVTDGVRVTEEGDARITEEGDVRDVEG